MRGDFDAAAFYRDRELNLTYPNISFGIHHHPRIGRDVFNHPLKLAGNREEEVTRLKRVAQRNVELAGQLEIAEPVAGRVGLFSIENREPSDGSRLLKMSKRAE